MENNRLKSRPTPLGGKLWLSVIVFGLIGQIAWVVENMYFATFAQTLFKDTEKFGNLYYVATTLMVILSAVTATVTTIFAGGLSDKIGKRKPFITIGFICWGLTIMLFAAIPIDFDSSKGKLITALLVIFDCIMTFAGSNANDAAFSAWTADITDVTNRGKVNTILAILPMFATVITIVAAMFTFDAGNYKAFFIILGIVPVVTGIISLFTLKDASHIVKSTESGMKEIFYGFSPRVIKANKMMFVCLLCLCLLGIAQQTFMSYIISFITVTLGITDYALPFGIVVVASALITAFAGVLYDKFGRKHFYIPLAIFAAVGTFLIYAMKFMDSSAYLPMLYLGGVIMLGANLSLYGGLQATFQDYIPKGMEGRFQGVRMCFMVLIPMIVGPLISLSVGVNSFDNMDAGVSAPPFEFFLIAAIVVVISIIPLAIVRKDADSLRQNLLSKKM